MKTYLYEDTCLSKASKENIWSVITDFEHWTDWNTSIEYMVLNSGLSVGANGTIKFVGTGEFDFEILKFDVNELLSLKIKTLVGYIGIIFSIVEGDEENYINEIIEFKGFLSFVYFKLYGEKLSLKIQTNLKHLNDLSKKIKN